jgi:hypothetical protein
MTGDTEPRPDFRESLREWFVEEMRRPNSDENRPRNELASLAPTRLDLRDEDRLRRTPRKWLLLAEVAAVIGVVAGLWWASNRPAEPTIPPAVASVPIADADPSIVVQRACRDFRTEVSDLALGASADEVVWAASDVRARLVAASAQLDELPQAFAEPRRLVAEAIDAADRLVTIAGEGRTSVDSAVRNLDLIIVAWGRELASIANDEACVSLPTLREVF